MVFVHEFRVNRKYIMVSSSSVILPPASLTSLQTNRLILRPINMDHVDALHRIIYADPDVAQFYAGEVQTLEETRDILLHSTWLNQHCGDQGWGSWAVIRKEDTRLIGRVNLGRPDRAYYTVLEDERNSPFVPLDTEIGYAIGKAYWGRGYASEGAQAVIDYAFHTLHIPRIVTPADADNVPSHRLLKRLGFRMKRNVHSEYQGIAGVLQNPAFPDISAPSGPGRPSSSMKRNKTSGPPFETDKYSVRGLELEDCEPMGSVLENIPDAVGFSGRMHSYEKVSGELLFVQDCPTGSRIREGFSGRDEGLGSFVIEAKHGRKPAGIIHLGPAARNYWIVTENDPQGECAHFEVDFASIIDPTVVSKPDELEVCEPLLAYALHDLRLARLVSHINREDVTSIDRFRNLGFRIEMNMHPLYGGYVAILDA